MDIKAELQSLSKQLGFLRKESHRFSTGEWAVLMAVNHLAEIVEELHGKVDTIDDHISLLYQRD